MYVERYKTWTNFSPIYDRWLPPRRDFFTWGDRDMTKSFLVLWGLLSTFVFFSKGPRGVPSHPEAPQTHRPPTAHQALALPRRPCPLRVSPPAVPTPWGAHPELFLPVRPQLRVCLHREACRLSQLGRSNNGYLLSPSPGGRSWRPRRGQGWASCSLSPGVWMTVPSPCPHMGVRSVCLCPGLFCL